jgi:hypothetical protein
LNLDALDESWDDVPIKKNQKKYTRIKEDEPEDYCIFSFDIMQKEQGCGSLKCEQSGFKLGFILQSLHSTLESLV